MSDTKPYKSTKDSMKRSMTVPPISKKKSDLSRRYTDDPSRKIPKHLVRDTRKKDPTSIKKLINPTNEPDGHCAACAFNAFMAFAEYSARFREAPTVGTTNFKIFGDWFYRKFGDDSAEKNAQLFIRVSNDKNPDMDNFQQKVSQQIIEHTRKEQPVILSVDYGTHWYSAYHKNDDTVTYVDAQTGNGFNTYSDKLYIDTIIDIIIPNQDVITEYYDSIVPQFIEQKGLGKRRKKTRKTRKKYKRH